jgi:DNA-binding MarR family transcriptional regulator
MSSGIDQSSSKGPPGRDLGLLGALAYEAYAGGLRRYLADRGYPDVKPLDTQLFRLLDARGGATITEIARLRAVTKQAASQHVAEFIERGYGRQKPSKDDARERVVKLTKRARKARKAGISYAKDVARELEHELGAEAVAAARAVFERVIEMNLEEGSEFLRVAATISSTP